MAIIAERDSCGCPEGPRRYTLRTMSKDTETDAPTDPALALEQGFREAIRTSLGDDFRDVDPQVRPAQNPEFGDYQVNAAMGLAKRVGKPPRTISELIVAALPDSLTSILAPPEVAGPGFINIRFHPESLGQLLAGMHEQDLGVVQLPSVHPVVIDMCGVNVAKQMHVGHLRSTIIGDALARVFIRLGHDVRRQNHLGDWGLQIAMVLHVLRVSGRDLDALLLSELDQAYRDAQLSCRSDHSGLEAARKLSAGPHRLAELEAQNAGADQLLKDVKQTLVSLQQGNESLVRDWQKLIDVTLRAVEESLQLLNVRLEPDSNRGESFYRGLLADVVADLRASKLAREDQGALVVPFDDRERPLLVQKSDGGYLYATTDLAALRFRVQELGASRVIYVVDARQRDHFRDVFDAVRLMGWDRLADGTTAEFMHIPFGSVLGEDRKPLKTRSGENITLRALLDEAIERGTAEVRRRAAEADSPTHGLDEDTLASIGRAVGIGAVKYADLSNDLTRDYIFSWERMIAFEGNTGPYIQYAHARICSIFGRAEIDPATTSAAPFTLHEPAERLLALMLLRYPAMVRGVAESLEPHRICTYLYELSNLFNGFYQACPVLKAEDPALRSSRLRLCDLVRRIIADGLDLLGIEAPSRM